MNVDVEDPSPATLRASRLRRQEHSAWWHLCSRKGVNYWLVLSLGCVAMLAGFPASRILSRLYYQDGGASQWLVAWLSVAGWPLTAAALLPFYLLKNARPTRLSWSLLFAYLILGFLTALDNLLFSWAYTYMPSSTASLISASALPFTAIFAYIFSGKKLNSFTLNAIIVIIAGGIILALDSSSDIPAGVTTSQYVLGFFLDIAGSALHGLIFALSELLFIKHLGRESTHVILEQQTMVSMLGFAFTSIGFFASGESSTLRTEARDFTLGPVSYCMVLVWTAVTTQVGILGSVAIMYSASALLAGVLNAAVVPVASVSSVIFLDDAMDGFKILSLLLTGWGFASYIYGSLEEARFHGEKGPSEPLLVVSNEISTEHE